MVFSLFFLFVLLVALMGARNVIAAHLQMMTWALTRKKSLGLMAYALVFLPGVIIHEMSHFLVAAVLGVPTGEIKLLPETDEAGTSRLGSVQTAKTDMFRSSLIGLAPLVFGSLSIIALAQWQFPQLFAAALPFGSLNELFVALGQVVLEPRNSWLLYLIFAIANTMFVSREDRRAWPGVILVLVTIGLVFWWTGTGGVVLSQLSQSLSAGVRVLTMAFLVSLGLDVIVLVPLVIAEKTLLKLRSRN